VKRWARRRCKWRNMEWHRGKVPTKTSPSPTIWRKKWKVFYVKNISESLKKVRLKIWINTNWHTQTHGILCPTPTPTPNALYPYPSSHKKWNFKNTFFYNNAGNTKCISQTTMLQDLQIIKNCKTKQWSPSYEQFASRYSKIGNHSFNNHTVISRWRTSLRWNETC